jgi:membrane protein implicated in regulation of membrane protease activity
MWNIVCWLVILALMLIIEMITLGLTTIWFGIGAVGAAIVAWAGAPFWSQIAVFFGLSVLSMALCRPIALKCLKIGKEKTNVEDVIGKTVLVSKSIDNGMETGEVKLNGIEWMARSEDGSVIAAGERVSVVAVQGVKLIVKKGG